MVMHFSGFDPILEHCDGKAISFLKSSSYSFLITMGR